MQDHHDIDNTQPTKLVLVADNDASHRLAIEKVFQRAGIESLPVQSCTEVTGIYEADPDRWAVILLSCELPGMADYQTVKTLRTFEYDNNLVPVPIIGVLSTVRDANPDQALAAGMDDTLAKPLDRQQLLAMVARYAPAQEEPTPTN